MGISCEKHSKINVATVRVVAHIFTQAPRYFVYGNNFARDISFGPTTTTTTTRRVLSELDAAASRLMWKWVMVAFGWLVGCGRKWDVDKWKCSPVAKVDDHDRNWEIRPVINMHENMWGFRIYGSVGGYYLVWNSSIFLASVTFAK